MMRPFLILPVILFLYSCSFHRVRLHKLNGTNVEEKKIENVGIAETLQIPSKKLKSQTGIYSLESGGESLAARLWLFDHAQKTIDIQYYSFSKDVTSVVACHHLLRAADRGVKVRILIDDAAARMNTDEVQLLESHDNIEIKVYNAGLRLGRIEKRLKELKKNYNRVLRRMHNKTLTVDSIACILGGRNIADRYFDYSKKYNFRDRDILVAGKEVSVILQSFDAFWQHTLSVPYSGMTRQLKRKKFKNPKRFDDIHHYATGSKKFSDKTRERIRNYHEELKAALDFGDFLFTKDVNFVSDEPGKNEDRAGRKGGPTLDTLLSFIKQSRFSIDIQSPYFILSDETTPLLKETMARGVKIRLLTNSMSTTDNYEAFSGYRRDRKKIAESGIQIFEFKKNAAVRYKLMVEDVQKKNDYKATYGFHPKTFIFDKKTAVVGSYNFDPRSADYNTECYLVIRSEEFVKKLLQVQEEEFLPENSWPVTAECNPDKKAGFRKRFKVAVRKIIPKKLL